MSRVKIKVPIWNLPGAGVAEKRMKTEKLEIECEYISPVTKQRLFPGVYTIATEKAKSFPYMMIAGNKIYKIPFSACKHIISSPTMG